VALPFIVAWSALSEATSSEQLDFVGGFVGLLLLVLGVPAGWTVYRRTSPKAD
jgi:hypothetical protein